MLLCLVLGVSTYSIAVRRITRLSAYSFHRLHSLPPYHGWYLVLCTLAPMLLWSVTCGIFREPILGELLLRSVEPEYLRQFVGGADYFLSQVREQVLSDQPFTATDKTLLEAARAYEKLLSQSAWIQWSLSALLVVMGFAIGYRTIDPTFRARPQLEIYAKLTLILCATASVFITLAIAFSVLFESLRFFSMVPVTEFLFGTNWSPQMAIRADQGGAAGAFGVIPLFTGTLLITLIAMLVAIPVGLLSAVYMAEYASRRLRNIMKPMLEILAGIPTVVYGYFAIITLSPLLRSVGQAFGLDVVAESALCAGVVMGVMIIPFVSSLSDDIITSVPRGLRDASLALGATQSETIKKVVLPAALPGIMGAVLLAISRAIGETMIVVMAAGLAANLTINPLESVTTVTVQIVSLLVGDQEFDSPKTLAAFALGLTLFIITLILNIIALVIVKKYREKYD